MVTQKASTYYKASCYEERVDNSGYRETAGYSNDVANQELKTYNGNFRYAYNTTTVTFTNEKVRHDLMITNNIDMTKGGNIDRNKEFSYTITFSGLDISKSYDTQLSEVNVIGVRTSSFTPNKENDYEFKFTLKHGQSLNIKDVPENAAYTITSAANEGYTSSFKVVGKTVDPFANDKENKELSTGKQKVEAEDLDVEFIFTQASAAEPEDDDEEPDPSINYVLPNSGMENQIPLIVLLMFCFVIFGMTYRFINTKNNKQN